MARRCACFPGRLSFFIAAPLVVAPLFSRSNRAIFSDAFAPLPLVLKQTKALSLSFTLNSSKEKQQQQPGRPDLDKTLMEIDHEEKDNMETAKSKWRRQDLFGESLIEQTVTDMNSDAEFQAVKKKYETIGAAAITKEERTRRRRALDALGIPSFDQFLEQKMGVSMLKRRAPTILQLNIGLYCNQACGHCHVESSPLRTEMMTAETAARCLVLLVNTPSIQTLDITGGAPELNDCFRYLVATARQLKPDLEIIDRCNLTVLQEPGQDDLVDFLKQHRVRIVASLPCYSEANVDQQRGNGVFERSIAALVALNDAGYGVDPALPIDLVYNPGGAFLPPAQADLQDQYKKHLKENFGILFNGLFTMTNMPIKRFADFLYRRSELQDYMQLLVNNFNADTVESLMCRDTVSVGYDGKLYDCDFNQQLDYGIPAMANHPDDSHAEHHPTRGISVLDVENLGPALASYSIRNDNHCFGCTAGMGSS